MKKVEQKIRNKIKYLSQDTGFISDSAMFRHKISRRLHQILRCLNVDSILFASLDNVGIHE